MILRNAEKNGHVAWSGPPLIWEHPSGYTLWRISSSVAAAGTLLSCFLLSFIRSIADFGTPVVIGGRFETVSTEIYMQVIGYSRLDKSAALNVLLLVPTILVFVSCTAI